MNSHPLTSSSFLCFSAFLLCSRLSTFVVVLLSTRDEVEMAESTMLSLSHTPEYHPFCAIYTPN